MHLDYIVHNPLPTNYPLGGVLDAPPPNHYLLGGCWTPPPPELLPSRGG